MNLHPIRAALPSNSAGAPNTSPVGDFSNSEAPAESPHAPTHTLSSRPSNNHHISQQAMLAFNIVIIILAISVVALLSYYLPRWYRRRKAIAFLSKCATPEVDSNKMEGTAPASSDGDIEKNVAYKVKLRKNPFSKLHFGRKQSHVRWGSDATAWDSDVWNVRTWDGEKRHSKSLSLGDEELGSVDIGSEPMVVPGDERQTRLNLRAGEGCDTFRGN